jgi:hypothetical protein
VSIISENIISKGKIITKGIIDYIFTRMLSFNGTTSYGELVEPWVSTDGNWTAEIVFVGNADTTTTKIVDGDSTGTTRLYLGWDSSGTVNFNTSVSTLSINNISQVNGSTAFPTDSKLYTAIFTGTSQAILDIFGQVYNKTGQFYGGKIKSATLTDNTTPANSREYEINSGSITHIVDKLDPTNTSKYLTLNNVLTSDWDNYYFDRSLGDNGGWISKTNFASGNDLTGWSYWNDAYAVDSDTFHLATTAESRTGITLTTSSTAGKTYEVRIKLSSDNLAKCKVRMQTAYADRTDYSIIDMSSVVKEYKFIHTEVANGTLLLYVLNLSPLYETGDINLIEYSVREVYLLA